MITWRYAYQRKNYTEKYNLHHDLTGHFTASDETHISVARDGPRPTKEWEKSFVENTRIRYEMYGEKHGMTPEEYKNAVSAQAQTLAKESMLFTRVKPATLQKILDGGRFKSQFETNKSGGTVNKDTRDHFESQAFGFDAEKQGVEERPIYGYLSKDAHGENTDADVSQYGNVAIEMRPTVRDRSTMTVGDSLAMTSGGHYKSVIPQPINHPNSDVYPLYNGIDPLSFTQAKQYYVEAQMHGGVTVHDIKSVAFHGKAPTAPLKKALKEAGIPFTVHL